MDANVLYERISRLKAVISRHSSGNVTVVAATKTIGADDINLLADAGILDIGENRAQELAEKRPHLSPVFRKHFIGQLQSNKALDVARDAHLIHSLDRASLATALNRAGETLGRAIPVLVEISLASEPQKGGITPEALPAFLDLASGMRGISVLGLMTVAPYVPDPQDARPVFRQARALFERLAADAPPGIIMRHLSMGMSGDFAVALEEGSNMIRVGTWLFGPRQ